MNDFFRGKTKRESKEKKVTVSKFPIPTHDPQTGELNPYYEILTGKKNPLSPN